VKLKIFIYIVAPVMEDQGDVSSFHQPPQSIPSAADEVGSSHQARALYDYQAG